MLLGCCYNCRFQYNRVVPSLIIGSWYSLLVADPHIIIEQKITKIKYSIVTCELAWPNYCRPENSWYCNIRRALGWTRFNGARTSSKQSQPPPEWMIWWVNDSKRDMCGISRNVNVINNQRIYVRTFQLKVMFREGHFLTVLLENGLPLAAWCEEVSLTMPEPNCCRRPEPWEQVDGRLDLILCMLLLNRNGTLLLVFGILPP